MEPPPRIVRCRGHELLGDPLLNKGTAFTAEERAAFGLALRFPPHVSTLDEQLERCLQNYLAEPTPLLRHAWLRALQDRNETLFYALLARNLQEMLPVVYTPTVAEACRRFSHLFQRPRGLFVTPENLDLLPGALRSVAPDGLDLVVATDNQRILGIGDQGVGGMGIPIGKCSLYVAAAGLHPARTLPVSLDVGTDNEELLRDPLYLGRRERRLVGPPYFAFLERFVAALRTAAPGAVLQWEDLGRSVAFPVLERWREAIPSFNDDIQGTAAMTLAGLLAAERLTGRRFRDSTLVVLGAGEAGLGLARHARALAGEEWARRHLFVLDSRGLLVAGGTLDPDKQAFAVDRARLEGWTLAGGRPPSLLEVVIHARPAMLVAATGQPGILTEEVVSAMARNTDRPVIFPLSNPTSHSEARPEDLYRWSAGRALVATGSPFEPVKLAGKLHRPAQANNVLVFPGIGLGTLVAGARRVSDGMFLAATRALSALVRQEDLDAGALFPAVARLREVSAAVATAVARAAWDEGLAGAPRPDDLAAEVASRMWEPRYGRYVAAPDGD